MKGKPRYILAEDGKSITDHTTGKLLVVEGVAVRGRKAEIRLADGDNLSIALYNIADPSGRHLASPSPSQAKPIVVSESKSGRTVTLEVTREYAMSLLKILREVEDHLMTRLIDETMGR